MENITAHLDSLYAKIEKLIHLHRILSEQNSVLMSEKQELINKNNSQEQEIKQLNESYKILKSAKSMAGISSDDARTKINELVREIDKCIGLLNK